MLPRPQCFYELDTTGLFSKADIEKWYKNKQAETKQATEFIKEDNEGTKIIKENKRDVDFPTNITVIYKKLLFVDAGSKTAKLIPVVECKYAMLIPLHVPVGGNCKIWVDGQTKSIKDEIIVFDAKKERYFSNEHYCEDLVVAIVGLIDT